MSCTVCHRRFSFFAREVACPGCSFSCCSKCLKYKSDSSEKGKKKLCGPCYNRYKSGSKSTLPKPADRNSSDSSMQEDNLLTEEPMVPVDIKKKLDSLENPAKPPITMYAHTSHWDKFKTGLDPADQEIVERLRKLKENDTNAAVATDDEIRRRLAILKDQDPDANNQKINIHRVDTRSDLQKAKDMIREYFEHLELASASNSAVSEIEKRLRALQKRDREGEGERVRSTEGEDTEDEEEHINKRLISKALAEAVLEKKHETDLDYVEGIDVAADMQESDDDEKPCCVMCDQTENLERCFGCNGDLYCAICFEDNHDEYELQKHKREPATRLGHV